MAIENRRAEEVLTIIREALEQNEHVSFISGPHPGTHTVNETLDLDFKGINIVLHADHD